MIAVETSGPWQTHLGLMATSSTAAGAAIALVIRDPKLLNFTLNLPLVPVPRPSTSSLVRFLFLLVGLVRGSAPIPGVLGGSRSFYLLRHASVVA